MFLDLVKHLTSEDFTQHVGGKRLDEAMSKAELKKMYDQVSVPSLGPVDTDVTFEGWLARIEGWGKLTYYHKDPENHWGKKKLSKRQFLVKISDDALRKQMGVLSIHTQKKDTRCVVSRDYVNDAGRHYVETFIVDVKVNKK